MMKSFANKTIATFIATLIFSNFASADEPVIPSDDFVYCTVCHGVQLMGNPVLKAPRLSGMDAAYVERQLRAFKTGLRGTHEQDANGREMQPMAAALTDEQIVDAAAFVAATRSPAAELSISGDLADGEQQYLSCAACHGVNGEGVPALNGPALTGLNDWYVEMQLANYVSGARGSQSEDSDGQQMRAAAQLLKGDDAIKNVAAYIATLGR